MFKLLVKWYTENRKWHQEHKLRYYIYSDGAETGDISFEKLGYMTPDKLCDAFIAAVIERVKMT